MNKELLTIEFRYHDEPKGYGGVSVCRNKTITIGVFDSLEQAVEAGNKALVVLSEKFDVRHDDKFKVKGLFGNPTRLVTNCCYSTKGIQYFAKITRLEFGDLSATIDETFVAFERYREYKRSEQD